MDFELRWGVALCLLAGGLEGPRGADVACGGEGPAGRTGGMAGRGLRVATWNLAWLAAWDHAGEVPRTEADYARLRRYAERLDADVIALQEVDGAQAAQRVFDPAAYDFHFSDREHVQRTGFAFRRTLSVARHPDVRALDVGGQRHGVDLTVFLPDGTPLRLLSVHLASGCFGRPLDDGLVSCRRLSAQLPVLEEWIDARSSAATPAAVLGDFNRRFFHEPDGDEAWRMLDDAQPPRSRLSSPTAGRKPTCLGGKYPSFIDHLLFNAPATTMLVDGSFREHVYDLSDAPRARVLSDHCPLSVRVEAIRRGGQGRRIVAGNP